MKITVTVSPKRRFNSGKPKEAWKVFKVTIPVWIRDIAMLPDGAAITHQEWAESGADMYVSITEIRESALRKISPSSGYIASKGHDFEWLACGFIPKSHVVLHMPWGGRKLHTTKCLVPVRSIDSANPWVFDWNSSMWVLDHGLYKISRMSSHSNGDKRKLTESDQEDDTGSQKREKCLKLTERTIQSLLNKITNGKRNSSTGGAPKHSEELPKCCTQCGQKVRSLSTARVDGPLSYLDLAMPSEHSLHKSS